MHDNDAQRFRSLMEADSSAALDRSSVPLTDQRSAAAAEYMAYQLGQINRKLDRLIAAAERIANGYANPEPYSSIKARKARGD